jgi:hypothetical protein
MTLQQGNWSLVYEAKPNDTDISRAALFINTTQKAAGTCVADYSVDTPYTPPDVAPAPAPSYAAPAPSRSNPVGIITGSHGAAVEVMLGSPPALMQIDTGASMTSLTAKAAHELLDAGEAHYSGESHLFTMANGSTSNEQEI